MSEGYTEVYPFFNYWFYKEILFGTVHCQSKQCKVFDHKGSTPFVKAQFVTVLKVVHLIELLPT